MRHDRRPYRVKKSYLWFRSWYTGHFLRPACDFLGEHATVMKPWYVSISGPNIRIGKCATIIGRVKIGVWGREPHLGRIEIGDYVMISPGTRISASDEIRIGHSVMMAHGVYITDSDWHDIYDRTRRSDSITPVCIGDNVWLGDHATVLKGVTIGDNSIVGARAVVSSDVPPNVVVAGNPARVVKQLNAESQLVARAEYFSDPEGLARFFDNVDRNVLEHNGFFNWLRVLLRPTAHD
jgi:acetyltransferase-like isoleucine patch superfamily enzyme